MGKTRHDGGLPGTTRKRTSMTSRKSKAITDALVQWKFKPYRRDGEPVEVETGVLFGRPQNPLAQPAAGASIE
jgi:hypothetical protein